MSAPTDQNLPDLKRLPSSLKLARRRRSLTQWQLACLTGINRVTINRIEKSLRLPTLAQLMRLAQVLQVSLQWFLAACNRPGTDLPDIAIELQGLGIVDLSVPGARVPGAFRPPEEVLALALSGDEPQPRIIEALPAVLAWNRWNLRLLAAYALIHDKRTKGRIAWLADATLTIDRDFGFPGGIVQRRRLEHFLARVRPPAISARPSPDNLDGLGRPARAGRLPPVWKRWGISYAADLSVFRKRAEHLQQLRESRAPG